MTIVEMLGQSGVLTLLGMGIVFGFLVILVIAVSFMGRAIRSLGAGTDADALRAGGSGSAGGGTGAVTAAVTAAVSEYRKTEK
jgi:oxaloacetate decarboxylase gamma subunit